METEVREDPLPQRAQSAAWGIPFLLGVILLMVGVGAALLSGLTGLASTLLFGGALVVAGVLEIVGALRDRLRNPALLLLLGGIFSTLVGLFFIFQPVAGLSLLTLLLGAYFIVGGLFSSITSIMDRYPTWGFDFAYGLVALALGLLVFRGWPASSAIWLGLFVGVEIAARGVTLMVASLEGRRLLQRARRQTFA